MKIKLWQKVVLGLMGGMLFGAIAPEHVEYTKIVGDLFLRAIKMIITPLIFFTLVSGITSNNSPQGLGKVAFKAIIAFIGTTIFAVMFGITIGLLMEPGNGVGINFGVQAPASTNSFHWSNVIINIVPDNILRAFVDTNVIQVVFIAVITGSTINSLQNTDSMQVLKDFINAVSKMNLKMISTIMLMSPYAAFALTAWVVGTQGFGIMVSLSKLVLAVTIAMICQYTIFGLLILIVGRISPLPFYKKSLEYQVVAFSTSSSKATLPITMQVCRDKLGISQSSTSFVLPLGASINMDGFAINLGLCTIFFAQMLNISLSMYDYLVIIITSTLCSIGGAGIPGASLVMLPMVLASVNIPIEGIAILAGIDRLLDMLRTTINITGDATITLLVDQSEGTLDINKYYS